MATLRLGSVLPCVILAIGCSRSPEPSAAAAPSPAAEPAAGPVAIDPAHKRDRHRPVDPDAPPLALEVVVAGAAPQTWHQDDLAKVPRFTVGADGEGRDVWSLRAIATTLAGPGACVTAVTGPGGAAPIPPSDWADATRTPVLHTTRRGTLKYVWADAKGAWGDTVVKDVARIAVAPAAGCAASARP